MGDIIRLHQGEAWVTVDPARGGMITSISVCGRELLLPPTQEWRPFPRWGSFVMAPWVGHLSHGELIFRDRTYRLAPNEGPHANHGLVAGVPWDLTAATSSTVILQRSLADLWPLGGVVRQQLKLSEHALTLVIEIEAESQAMPVGAGWHPWFRRRPDTRVRVAADQFLQHADVLPTGALQQVDAETDLRNGPELGDRQIDVVYVDARPPASVSDADIDVELRFDPPIESVVV